MRKKRIMVIGPRGCGKTSLVNYINEYEGPLRRTQDVIYGPNTIDVPSAYIESGWMYKHLIALSQDAWCAVVMLDQAKATDIYSHGFAKALYCRSVGVINKTDTGIMEERACEKQLKMIGVEEPYFYISMKEGTGLEELRDYLLMLKERIEGEE